MNFDLHTHEGVNNTIALLLRRRFIPVSFAGKPYHPEGYEFAISYLAPDIYITPMDIYQLYESGNYEFFITLQHDYSEGYSTINIDNAFPDGNLDYLYNDYYYGDHRAFYHFYTDNAKVVFEAILGLYKSSKERYRPVEYNYYDGRYCPDNYTNYGIQILYNFNLSKPYYITNVLQPDMDSYLVQTTDSYWRQNRTDYYGHRPKSYWEDMFVLYDYYGDDYFRFSNSRAEGYFADILDLWYEYYGDDTLKKNKDRAIEIIERLKKEQEIKIIKDKRGIDGKKA